MTKPPEQRYERYHAHVYFDQATVVQARALCEAAGGSFDIQVGRVHEREVGPHPRWSCQLSFDAEQFDGLMAWLDQHRDGLDVLVHGVTGEDLADHTTHASWLGNAWDLKLHVFNSQR